MLFLPHPGQLYRQYNYSGLPATTSGTALVADGTTAHTLGAITEIISATSFDAWRVLIWFHESNQAATRTDALVNIYVGASSAEVVLLANLVAGWRLGVGDTGGTGGMVFDFPLYIPAGTRISGACQALELSKSVSCNIELWGGGMSPPHWVGTGVETLGANTASSTGTSVTPGSASDGTFTNIGTSTREYGHICIQPQGTLTDTNILNNTNAWDIGTGDAEIPGLQDFWTGQNGSQEAIVQGSVLGRPCRIPAGTALQVRGQNSGTAEPEDVCLYGVY